MTFYPQKWPHSSFENNTGRTDGRMDATSYRDAKLERVWGGHKGEGGLEEGKRVSRKPRIKMRLHVSDSHSLHRRL